MKNGKASPQQGKSANSIQMDWITVAEVLLSIQTPLWALWQIQSVFFNWKQEPSKLHWYKYFSHLLLTFVMTNVYFTLGFRRTDGAAQLCILGTTLSISECGHFTDESMPLRTRTLYSRCCTLLYWNHNFLEDHRLVPICFILLCHKHITTVLHTGFLLLMHPLLGLSTCSWYKPFDKPWKQPAAHPALSAARYERNVTAKRCRVTRQKPPGCLQQGRKYHIKIKAWQGKSAHFRVEKYPNHL